MCRYGKNGELTKLAPLDHEELEEFREGVRQGLRNLKCNGKYDPKARQ